MAYLIVIMCILHGSIDWNIFEFQEQKVKLGQLEYNLVKLVIE